MEHNMTAHNLAEHNLTAHNPTANNLMTHNLTALNSTLTHQPKGATQQAVVAPPQVHALNRRLEKILRAYRVEDTNE
jgi:hypothetical protein